MTLKKTQSEKTGTLKTETREWSAAATELACFALARMNDKDLVEIIDTKRSILRFICIFKDKEQ